MLLLSHTSSKQAELKQSDINLHTEDCNTEEFRNFSNGKISHYIAKNIFKPLQHCQTNVPHHS